MIPLDAGVSGGATALNAGGCGGLCPHARRVRAARSGDGWGGVVATREQIVSDFSPNQTSFDEGQHCA